MPSSSRDATIRSHGSPRSSFARDHPSTRHLMSFFFVFFFFFSSSPPAPDTVTATFTGSSAPSSPSPPPTVTTVTAPGPTAPTAGAASASRTNAAHPARSTGHPSTAPTRPIDAAPVAAPSMSTSSRSRAARPGRPGCPRPKGRRRRRRAARSASRRIRVAAASKCACGGKMSSRCARWSVGLGDGEGFGAVGCVVAFGTGGGIVGVRLLLFRLRGWSHGGAAGRGREARGVGRGGIEGRRSGDVADEGVSVSRC